LDETNLTEDTEVILGVKANK